MTPKTIPIIAGNPAHTFSIVLNNITYNMTARWNSRAEFWTLDIADENKSMLIANIALKCGLDLLEPFNLNIGNLYATDITKSGLEPSLDNIGTDVLLVYIAPEG